MINADAVNRGLPSSAFARAYLKRATWIWVGTRLIVSLMLLLGGGIQAVVRSAIVDFSAIPLFTIGIATVLGLLDIRIRQERALIGNLGIAQPVVAGMFVLCALAGELVFALAMAPL